MNRYLITAMLAGLTLSSVQAVPPGTLDGENIPTDFANSKRIGVQTNHTAVGDVTSLGVFPDYSEGTELDAMYLAKDFDHLYIGLAGNVAPIGNPFIILIDSEFDFGQTELRTEGVGGPPWMVQLLGREVVFSDNGTPNDPNDDTYTVTPNSGTLLPDCGDGSFTGWDYALAVDVADDDNMYVHEYQLFDFQVGAASAADLCNYADGRGRVPCDPTPDNPSDTSLPVYSIRNLVATSPEGDGNETIEGGDSAFGYTRGGWDNSNTAGVTDSDASDAATALTGLELAIPLANIGSGVFDTDTIRIVVLTMDADEYQTTTVSDEFGSVINQALPSFSGPDCNATTGLGKRPDLSAIASCLEVDLNSLDVIRSGAVMDGVINPNDYDANAPILTQQCPTSAGDQAPLSDRIVPEQPGSELNQLFVDNDDQYLYLGLTGNLEADNKSLSLFIDTDAKAGGGDALISDFSNFTLDGTYERWDPNDPNTIVDPNLISGAESYTVQAYDFGGGYKDIIPNINAPTATDLNLDIVINPANQAEVVRVLLTDADGTERIFDFDIAGLSGAQSLTRPLDSYDFDISAGSVPGLDLTDLSFFHIAGDFSNGKPGNVYDITFDNLALSDADQGSHTLDFVPSPASFTSVQITDFGDFSLLGTYESWGSATFTSGSDSFQVQSTGGFGGGYADINPNVNLTGLQSVELEVTVNAGTSGGGEAILVVLSDGDDTQLRWSFGGLQIGANSLSLPLSAGAHVYDGGDGEFDFSDISFIHIQSNYDEQNITFEDLSATTIVPGAAPLFSLKDLQLPNGPLDVLGNGLLIPDLAVGYDIAYGIDLSYGSELAYVNFINLVTNEFAYRGSVGLESGSATLFDDPGGEVASNPNGLMMAVNNTNVMGVVGCDDPNLACFDEDAATVAAQAETTTTGIEMAIPLADLGLTSLDLPKIIQLSALVNDKKGFASNQSLPAMRNTSYEGNQVVNPGQTPVNLTDPTSGPSTSVLITDFANFDPNGAFGVWTFSDFTSGPDDFTVDSHDFGGCYYFLNPLVDATGTATIELEVTLNPDNQTDRLVLVLFDTDGSVWLYRWDNLTNGTQTLRRALTEPTQIDAAGAEPGLNLASLGQINLQGAFHNGNPGDVMDITFHNLQLVGGVRNFEARAARICLGTVAGDGDCDGDNDMADAALLQQCFGKQYLVPPMECLQLDLVPDGEVNKLDYDSFETLITGP